VRRRRGDRLWLLPLSWRMAPSLSFPAFRFGSAGCVVLPIWNPCGLQTFCSIYPPILGVLGNIDKLDSFSALFSFTDSVSSIIWLRHLLTRQTDFLKLMLVFFLERIPFFSCVCFRVPQS
jgi:hypothetical protein